jgi:hypothetical protein
VRSHSTLFDGLAPPPDETKGVSPGLRGFVLKKKQSPCRANKKEDVHGTGYERFCGEGEG